MGWSVPHQGGAAREVQDSEQESLDQIPSTLIKVGVHVVCLASMAPNYSTLCWKRISIKRFSNGAKKGGVWDGTAKTDGNLRGLVETLCTRNLFRIYKCMKGI